MRTTVLLPAARSLPWVLLVAIAGSFVPQARAAPGDVTNSVRQAPADLPPDGTWSVSCDNRPTGSGGNVCTFSQDAIDHRSGQQRATVQFRPTGDGVDGVFVLPLGLSIAKGIAMALDQTPADARLAIRTCLPIGCLVDVKFGAETVVAIGMAASLTIKATSAESGQEVTIKFSLAGFRAAMEQARNLMK